MSITQMKAWIEDSYWAWRNAWYFRFDSYEDAIDRGAFFEEINLGWLEMYADPYDADPSNLQQYYSLVMGDSK
jgi:hypothetical protein